MDISYIQQPTVFVSIIVPCFNEEKFISRCLDSIIDNGYPINMLEVLVIDGNSTDKTREIVEYYAKRCTQIKLLVNPKRILAAAWNIGIRNAKGEIIMALNAHGIYRNSYISSCIGHLNSSEADYVGGIIVTLPRNNSFIGKAIATVLSHPFGVGNSHFRIGSKVSIHADTASFGGYRKGIFEKIGLFNEELRRSQDIEFHLRLKKAGYNILLVPDMICDYYIRSSLKEFCRDWFINGYWVIYPLKYTAVAISWRHLVPLTFVLSLFGLTILSAISSVFVWLLLFVFISYILVNLYFSFTTAIQKKSFQYLLLMPMLFAILHIGYGIGSGYAGIKILWSKKFWNNLWALNFRKTG